MANNQVNSGTWTNPLPTVVDRNWELILNSLSDWLANPNIAQGGLTVGDPQNGEVIITGSGGTGGNNGEVQFWFNGNHDGSIFSIGDNTVYITDKNNNILAQFGQTGFTLYGNSGDNVTADSGGMNIQLGAGRHLQVNSVSILPESSWTAPSMGNGWVNYGGTTNPVGFKKVGTRVFLRGQIKSGTVGATIFTLPVGYRPTGDVNLAVSSNNAYGNLIIYASGVVALGTGSNAYVNLESISFDTT